MRKMTKFKNFYGQLQQWKVGWHIHHSHMATHSHHAVVNICFRHCMFMAMEQRHFCPSIETKMLVLARLHGEKGKCWRR